MRNKEEARKRLLARGYVFKHIVTLKPDGTRFMTGEILAKPKDGLLDYMEAAVKMGHTPLYIVRTKSAQAK